MRNLLLLLLPLLATAQTTHRNDDGPRKSRYEINGNGQVTTEERTVGSFTELTACCKIRVEVTQGEVAAVRVEAESNLIDVVKTEVTNGRLEVFIERGANLRAREEIMVYVTAPALSYVGGRAGADVTFLSMFEGPELRIDANSGATVAAQFTGDRLQAKANSGGRVEVRGTGAAVRASASSGAAVSAEAFSAKTAEASASSGGGVKVSTSESLLAKANSGGRVRYRGSATDVETNTSSGGSVRKE